jgi:hypothetical protein
MELHTIGIDLAKTVFHLVGLNLHGEVVAAMGDPPGSAPLRSKERGF